MSGSAPTDARSAITTVSRVRLNLKTEGQAQHKKPRVRLNLKS